MKKDKKTMQNNVAKQNVEVNELSGGDLEKTSGGVDQTIVLEGTKDAPFLVSNKDYGNFLPNKKTQGAAKNLANLIDTAINTGKFHDMRDRGGYGDKI